MISLIPYLIVAWIVLMIGIFPSFASPRRAVLFIMLSGTLFLPEAIPGALKLGTLPIEKYFAVSYAAFFGVLIYDSERLWAGTPRWFDLPMLALCLCSFPTALTNEPPPDGGSPFRDAFAQTMGQITMWGIPYLLGRLYFCDRSGMRELAFGVVVAATVYAPFCLYEVKMSAILHTMVYGYSQSAFGQTMRFGGWRPMVFLPHGLALAMFMAGGALIVAWLWLCETSQTSPGTIRRGVSAYLGRMALLLIPTAVMTKSTGAVGLGLGGGCLLWLTKQTHSRWWLLSLAAVPPVYVMARTTGLWDGQEVVDSASANIEEDRGQSLNFRLVQENYLMARAFERPVFGWGGWGRNRVANARGQDTSVTDSLWIIIFGTYGFLGLTALGTVLLLPVARFALLFSPSFWCTRAVGPAVACSVVLALLTIDSLVNAMVLPIYFVIAGALMGLNPDDFSEPEITHESN